MNKIPLVDLKAQYHAYKQEFDEAIQACLEHTSFIGGPDHEAFTHKFAEFCGGGYVVPTANGTDAITLALVELLGQGNGSDEIITVSHTFIATTEAISSAGYKPVMVDIDPHTYLMDVSKVEAAINPHTKAILPVHLYGQMVDMQALMAVAQRYQLVVLEDAAQAHGASFMGRSPGHWSGTATFSFYPGKNLGAYGDAGAIFTVDADLASRILQRANHGRIDKYLHLFEGVSSRLDGLQAAVLRVKLRYLADWNTSRRRAAGWYNQLLSGTPGITTPTVHPQAVHVYHIYPVLVENRDEILKQLHEDGIGAGVHYPVPLHEQPAYAHLNIAPEALPVSHRVGRTELSLPIYPELTFEQAEYVADCLKRAVKTVGAA